MSTQLQSREQIEIGVATTATVLILLSAALNSPLISVLVSATALTVLFFTHRRGSTPSLALKITASALAAVIAGATILLING